MFIRLVIRKILSNCQQKSHFNNYSLKITKTLKKVFVFLGENMEEKTNYGLLAYDKAEQIEKQLEDLRQSSSAGLSSQVSSLASRISTNEGNISTLSTTVGGHTESLSSLASSVESMGRTVNSISSTVSGQAQSISSLTGSVSSHTSSISTLSSDLLGLSSTVNANSVAITQLQSASGGGGSAEVLDTFYQNTDGCTLLFNYEGTSKDYPKIDFYARYFGVLNGSLTINFIGVATSSVTSSAALYIDGVVYQTLSITLANDATGSLTFNITKPFKRGLHKMFVRTTTTVGSGTDNAAIVSYSYAFPHPYIECISTQILCWHWQYSGGCGCFRWTFRKDDISFI